jgi:hypothetical protein
MAFGHMGSVGLEDNQCLNTIQVTHKCHSLSHYLYKHKLDVGLCKLNYFLLKLGHNFHVQSFIVFTSLIYFMQHEVYIDFMYPNLVQGFNVLHDK